MTTQTTEQSEAHLSEVTIKQLTWKPTMCQQIAIAIVKYFIANPFGFHFTDDIDLSFVSKDDAHCVGTSWKRLTTAGIIERGTNYRRSTRPNNNGSAVFDYRLKCVNRARTFLERNAVKLNDDQPNLL